MSLYQKHRPQTLADVQGNRNIVTTLKGLFATPEKMPHTFLFHGETGCGKTTIARIVAENLGCTENNLVEIDTGQFTGIDTVRDIRKSAQFIPLGGGVRVFIIDEVHRMTKDAQNAFLKILEDTPPHIYFILCTTNEKSLLPTIRGRCSQFQVSLLNDSQMEDLLFGICEKEDEKIEVEVIQTIVKSAEGHPRNALTILEQVFATPERRRIKVAEQAQILEAEGRELCQALLQQKGWGVTKNILKGLQEQDPEGLRRMVLGYMKAVLLNTDSEQAGYIMECFIEPFYNTGFPGLVYASYQVIKN